ncbi:ubiquinol-cytochrome c reductase iron-sulfur subunit [Cognatiluteimonas weifangensis]|uniref:Ubiquinol-cytochrome c reductase iron-sulfur subunit n=1 Tax=Cognatiluteimonas weifangensis TaxID=2303539 RepID=A0A372DSB8_9GAMM|nr:ubiquinol-cytochrome c reductase iron-sulfur subunit [Luteimonas weifangensis]RFP62374.1 ubiquinol-cytochrome c reductase iron-sulfur subunit [Luteimonas weifangensis]
MGNDGVENQGRRRFLTATTAVVGAVGAGFAAVPFIKSWNPSAQAKLAGAPVTADIGALPEGQQLTLKWRGQPVYVAHRSKAMLDVLPTMDKLLLDPKSDNTDQQPEYAKNEYRSIKPEYLVLIAVCTHLGCAPEFVPELAPQPFDPDWKGGYFCPCHKSRYDLSGRVYSGQPAPANLPVPPYHFENDTTLVIGVDPQGAA